MHSAPPAASSTRRGFLGALSFVLGGAIAALAAVPVLGSVLSPLRRSPGAEAVPPIPVGSVNDFPVGVARRVELVRSVEDAWSRSEGTTVGAAWVTRQEDGSFTALSTVCPHLGCGVNRDDKGGFRCPCHTSAFAPNGARISGPAPRGLDPLRVEVRGETVLVHHQRFKQGVPDRQEV
ncbi:ubiquinol-cytochrome c reductase iron-sulfur subunit [Myxococcaceae bacterium GXIMD 01537]